MYELYFLLSPLLPRQGHQDRPPQARGPPGRVRGRPQRLGRGRRGLPRGRDSGALAGFDVFDDVNCDERS